MKKLKLQVFNESPFELPAYATEFASGLDIKADFSRMGLVIADELGITTESVGKDGCFVSATNENNTVKKVTIPPLGRFIIPTGLYVAVPEGWELQVCPRSGLSYKIGLSCANARGCIDSDYRGEIGVIAVNLSNQDLVIEHGERVAQLILSETPQVEWEPVTDKNDLGSTERGAGGFGHTGKH